LSRPVPRLFPKFSFFWDSPLPRRLEFPLKVFVVTLLLCGLFSCSSFIRLATLGVEGLTFFDLISLALFSIKSPPPRGCPPIVIMRCSFFFFFGHRPPPFVVQVKTWPGGHACLPVPTRAQMDTCFIQSFQVLHDYSPSPPNGPST